MTVADPIVMKTPRELLRRQYQDWFDIKAQEIASGPLEGKKVVLMDDVRFILQQPFEPASEHGYEAQTPARVVVWATCPRCGQTAPVAIEITPELRVDSVHGALHLKAKSKPVSHTCGQLGLRDQVDGQESFELEDIIGNDGEALAPGDIVRVADDGAGYLIGPIVRFETDEEIAEAEADLDEGPQTGRQIVVADPENSDHVVFAFPVDADRLTTEELEVNQWQRCDFAFCPLALEHRGNHTPLKPELTTEAVAEQILDIVEGAPDEPDGEPEGPAAA
jgi:hypothetical protein